MPWKQRGRHRYWYRSVRRGTSVRSIYVGRGSAADFESIVIQLIKHRQRDGRRRELMQHDDLRHAVARSWRSARALVSAAFIALGFYAHARTWRKRMTARNSPVPTATIARADFDALVRLANGGDDRAIRRLQRVLDENPAIWRQVGDLSRHAELTIVRAAAGDNILARECFSRHNDALREALAGPKPTPLRKLVADQIVLAKYESDYWRMRAAASTSASASRAAAHHAGAAQQRLHRSLKMLELVDCIDTDTKERTETDPVGTQSTLTPTTQKGSQASEERQADSSACANRISRFFEPLASVG